MPDFDPSLPTSAKPGSEDKVNMMAARYAAGLPLWNEGDNDDHGPCEGGGDDEWFVSDFNDDEEAAEEPTHATSRACSCEDEQEAAGRME